MPLAKVQPGNQRRLSIRRHRDDIPIVDLNAELVNWFAALRLPIRHVVICCLRVVGQWRYADRSSCRLVGTCCGNHQEGDN
jgi:hypothetical protein